MTHPSLTVALSAWLIVLAAPVTTLPVAEPAADPRADATFEDLLKLELDPAEPYRILRLSQSIYYAQFESPGTRQLVFEGISPDLLMNLRSLAAVTVPEISLRASYAATGDLHGLAGDFQQELYARGFLQQADPPSTRALITLAAPAGDRTAFDFSYSRGLQAVTERQEAIDRLEGRTPSETFSLRTMGADHPSIATFEAWRFDHLADASEVAGQAVQEKLARARRAVLTAELIHAIHLVEPDYEPAILRWIQSELDPDDRRVLVQLLQLTGFRAVRLELFVREVPAQLFDVTVLVAGMYQQLERVTAPGKRGYRKLAPERFRNREVLEQAAAFYGRFFATNRRGEYAFSLTDEMWAFVRKHSARVQEISTPFIEEQLGADWNTASTSETGPGSR